MSADDGDTGRARRPAAPERRRYNRRSAEPEVAPPYFSAFDRIAKALEDIRDQLVSRQVVLPTEEDGVRPPVPRGGRHS